MDAEAPRGAPGAGCSWHGGPQQQAGAAVPTCTLMDDLTLGPTLGSAFALGLAALEVETREGRSVAGGDRAAQPQGGA